MLARWTRLASVTLWAKRWNFDPSAEPTACQTWRHVVTSALAAAIFASMSPASRRFPSSLRRLPSISPAPRRAEILGGPVLALPRLVHQLRQESRPVHRRGLVGPGDIVGGLRQLEGVPDLPPAQREPRPMRRRRLAAEHPGPAQPQRID